MHMEPSWSPIPPRFPGMLPRGRLHLHAAGLPWPLPAHGQGTRRARSPPALRRTPTSLSGSKLAAQSLREGKGRSPWKHAAKLGERLLPSKGGMSLSDHQTRMKRGGLWGAQWPRGHEPQPAAPRKTDKMHKGDSSRRCRQDALLQERICRAAARMPRPKRLVTHRSGWEP